MLKAKFKILISVLIITMLLSTSCFATEGDVANNEDASTPVATSEDQATQGNETTEENVDISTQILFEDLYHFDIKDAVIQQPIDGNTVIVGDNVTITNEIAGNVIVFAKTLNVTSKACIYSNLYVVADEVNINGTVNYLFAAAKKIKIESSGSIYKDANITANTVQIGGSIQRNAFIKSNVIEFTPEDQAHIQGKLNYASSENKKLSDELVKAVVVGDTSFKVLKSTQILGKAMNVLMYAVFILLVGLTIKKLNPDFINYTASFKPKNILVKLGFGFVTFILAPAISLLLVVTYVGMLAGLLLLAIYALLLATAVPMFCTSVATAISKALKLEGFALQVAVLFGIALVASLLTVIPVVGILFMILFALLGVGNPLDYITADKKEI